MSNKEYIKNVNFDERTWEEFRATNLLWWINRTLHLFGWVIVFEVDTITQEFLRAFPARTNVRGFDAEIEEKYFRGLTEYIHENSNALLEDVKDERDS